MIDLTSKLREINDIEHNKGSKIGKIRHGIGKKGGYFRLGMCRKSPCWYIQSLISVHTVCMKVIINILFK